MNLHGFSPWGATLLCTLNLALLPGPGASARAQTQSLTFNPVADATLIETEPDSSMGGATFINSGTTGMGTRNRALVRFDLSGAIPPGSVVEAAYVNMTVVFVPNRQIESSLFGLHRVLQAWGEGDTQPEVPNFPGLGGPAQPGDATWNDRFYDSGQPWTAPGGMEGADFVANASSVEFIEVEDTYRFDTTPRLNSDVQSWVDNPAANHGWMLKSFSEDLEFTARRWGSSEDAFDTPVLTVTFTPVPEPSLLALAGLGAGLFWAARRRGRRGAA